MEDSGYWKVGDRLTLKCQPDNDNGEFILARISWECINLISVKDGNRWTDEPMVLDDTDIMTRKWSKDASFFDDFNK